MSLTLSERRPVVREFARQYRTATKTQKARVLEHFLATVERSNSRRLTYNRKYAAMLLRNSDRTTPSVDVSGKPVLFVAHRGIRRRKRPPKYASIVLLIESLYKISAYLAPKRLRAFIDDVLSSMRARGEITCTDVQFTLLQAVSSATLGRLLKPFRTKHQIKGRSHTRRGTLLKHQIPVRHHGDWPDEPGFFEIDLVGHDGGDGNGQFCYTLTAYDPYTTVTILSALQNKAQRWSHAAIKKMRAELPYAMKGIDSDCGGEFINHALLNYCRQEPRLAFTRAREGRKNDNCYVEERNNSTVRKHIGYDRYESDTAYDTLAQCYEKCLNAFVFHFQPSMKVKERTREGGKTKKKYDQPRTPYQRVMELSQVSATEKVRLKLEHDQLSPVVLSRELTKYQERLLRVATKRMFAKEHGFQQLSAVVNNV